MSVHKKTAGNHVAVGTVWLTALAALLFSCTLTGAQETPVRPLRARPALQQANEAYKRGDYELAAKMCDQARTLQRELSDSERRDLDALIKRNNTAVQGRRDGRELLRKADEALAQNRKPEAASYLNKAKANQYLSPADQQTLSSLYEKLRGTSAKLPPVAPRTARGLLHEARNALKRGDLDEAEKLAQEARPLEKRLVTFPWEDTVAKVMRDIRFERSRQQALQNVPMNPNPPGSAKKEKSPFNGIKSFFRLPGQTDPASTPPPGAPMPPVNDAAPRPKVSDNSSNPDTPAAEIQPAMAQKARAAAPDQPVSTVSRSTAVPSTTVPPSTVPPTTVPPSSVPPSMPPPSTEPGARTAQARKLLQDGYKALFAKDYDLARRLAFQAQDLRPDLEWWEMNPEKLLADIQAKAPSGVGARLQGQGRAVVRRDNDAKDAKGLLKQARSMYQQKNYDEAERLCVQAAAAPDGHWGLFEDSPEKLRVDIQKARTVRDREESVRLLAEARRLYGQGDYQQAKLKAWRAQQLHGPYNVWELGDRPSRLLSEIERAERKNGGKTTDAKPGPSGAREMADQMSQASVLRGRTQPASVPGMPSNETKARAIALLNEARDLQKRNMLLEARERAVAARQLNVAFAPEGDSPDLCLQDLAWFCNKQVDGLLKRADDTAGRVADAARFQKAEADLAAARSLAGAFGQDLVRIDQKIAWLRQLQTGTPSPTPPALQQTAAAGTPQGADLLEKSRAELKAGNTRLARRLAEDAFDPKYGVQKDAENLLRSIDVEEHNQKILAADREFDAVMDAFKRRDFRTARTILGSIDVRLLGQDRQRFVREIANNPEMQPGAVAMTKNEVPTTPGVASPNAPGAASVEDRGPGDGDSEFSKYREMENIIYQKLLVDSKDAQRKALSYVQNGDVAQAIELLKEHLDQLSRTQIDPARLSLLKGQVENRLAQYKTLQARNIIESEQKTAFVGPHWNEGKYQGNILKRQDEVSDLMKQYGALMKQGKFKEAKLAALKAKELDPDNVAADAGIHIATIRERENTVEQIKGENEELFLKAQDPRMGPYVDIEKPVALDKAAYDRASKRDNGSKGISAPSRNPIERGIERKLSSPITVNFKEVTLSRVIEDLHALSGINIVPDLEALREQNITLDAKLSLMVENVSLKSALNLLLRQTHLTYVIGDEVLKITTENNAKGRMKPVTYSVADLIIPVENNPGSDVNSLEKVLEGYMSRMSGISTGNTPFLNVYSLPNGQNVGSSSSSGSTAAQQGGASMAAQHASPRPIPGQTIENLLMDLIKTTISPDSWTDQGGAGTVQYYPLGMALVINQTQDVQEQVADLLVALRRLQDLEVAVELRMVSVSEAFFERIGVDFSLNILTHNGQADKNELVNSSFTPFGLPNSFQPGKFVSGLTPAGTFTPDLNIPIKTGSFGLTTPPFGGYPGTLTQDGGISLGLAFLSDIQVFMFLEAAQGDRRLNVMQAPKVTVFNGQTALINVQDQQFFLLNITPSFTPFGNLIFTPNNVPVPLGVTLRVTPVISADRRFVRLNLVPTMTNLASATVPLFPVQFPVPLSLFGPGNNNTQGPPEGLFQMFFQQPTFTTISVSTTVNVPDGGTVLMGGLKTLNEGRSEYGPPILSKIPYINRLFKNVGYGRDAQSLMLMVTPRIIINEEEERIFTGQEQPIPRP